MSVLRRYRKDQMEKNKLARRLMKEMTKMSGIPYGKDVRRVKVCDLAHNSKSLNDDIQHFNKVFRATGEFRAPKEGEYWLSPKLMEILGPAVDTTAIFNQEHIGFSRVILKIVNIHDNELTQELLMSVLLGEKFVTVRCFNCECDGTIGNLSFRRSPTDKYQIQFFHTGSEYAFAYYNLLTGEFFWEEDFDPNEVNIITVTKENPLP